LLKTIMASFLLVLDTNIHMLSILAAFSITSPNC
jgi:hypothetical protein